MKWIILTLLASFMPSKPPAQHRPRLVLCGKMFEDEKHLNPITALCVAGVLDHGDIAVVLVPCPDATLEPAVVRSFAGQAYMSTPSCYQEPE